MDNSKSLADSLREKSQNYVEHYTFDDIEKRCNNAAGQGETCIRLYHNYSSLGEEVENRLARSGITVQLWESKSRKCGKRIKHGSRFSGTCDFYPRYITVISWKAPAWHPRGYECIKRV